MTRKYVNSLNGVIKRLGVGDHSEPTITEDHIDINDNGVAFWAYWDEYSEEWKSANTVANYVFGMSGNELFLARGIGVPIGSEVTWSNIFSVNNEGKLQFTGFQRTQYDKTSSTDVQIVQSGCTITNIGAIGDIVLTLPQATAGLKGLYYHFHVQEAHELKIQVQPSDFIHKDGTGYLFIRSSNIDDSLTLVCISEGIWVVESLVGIWSVV